MSNLKKSNIFKLLVVAAIALSFNMLYLKLPTPKRTMKP